MKRSVSAKRHRQMRISPSCLVYTPAAIATAMVQALGSEPGDQWLEPCVGKGALLQALSKEGIDATRVRGIDLSATREETDQLANVSRRTEFLRWSLDTEERFDKIIANPPYIAIERVQKAVRCVACNVETIEGVRVRAGANVWYAFLCAAIGLLRPNGSLCFLLPAAWEFADYARPLREVISRYFEQVAVFRSDAPLFKFAGVQEGAIILLAKRYAPEGLQLPSASVVSRSFSSPIDIPVLVADLNSVKSRQDQLATMDHPSPNVIRSKNTKRFDELITVGIGAVTGDADYFLMNNEQRRSLGVPLAACRPVLSRARHLVAHTIDLPTWRELRDSNERVFLFMPSERLKKHPGVAAHLRWGKSGGCDVRNHKIAIRSPWYRVHMPPAFDGFLSGMSNTGPWIAFNRMARLTATNTLYGVVFAKDVSYEQRFSVALSLLSSEAREQLAGLQRRYADGLIKYELGDLKGIRLPVRSEARGAEGLYKRVIDTLLLGDTDGARAMADQWFTSLN
jgi:adenine-specific DNA-methyltransferase